MAFSTKIEVLKYPFDRLMLRVEPHWWPSRELMTDGRFEYFNETGSYADYIAELTVSEFLELHSKYRPLAGFDDDAPKMSVALVTILDQLEHLLNVEHDRIRVTVYEWESGLD